MQPDLSAVEVILEQIALTRLTLDEAILLAGFHMIDFDFKYLRRALQWQGIEQCVRCGLWETEFRWVLNRNCYRCEVCTAEYALGDLIDGDELHCRAAHDLRRLRSDRRTDGGRERETYIRPRRYAEAFL